MKSLDICKPLYDERGNVIARHLDDEIERIHKERADKKEERGSKEDDNDDDNDNDNDDDDDTREREEWEVSASLEDASVHNDIYGAITSGQGTTKNNAKDDAMDDYDEEGRMVGIPQFWVCATGHMEAVAELIMKRDAVYQVSFNC